MDSSILSSCTNSYDICSANSDADLSEIDVLEVDVSEIDVLELEGSETEEFGEVGLDVCG